MLFSVDEVDDVSGCALTIKPVPTTNKHDNSTTTERRPIPHDRSISPAVEIYSLYNNRIKMHFLQYIAKSNCIMRDKTKQKPYCDECYKRNKWSSITDSDDGYDRME